MDKISKLMYGSNENIEKRNIIWNMLGSFVYAITGMCIGIVVSYILGADMGGIFFFAFSTLGQQLYIVAYFGIRPIQITDSTYKYSFGDYLTLRIATSAVAIISGLVYTLLFSRSFTELCVYLLMLTYKVLDAVADCYESEWQRKGRLYIAGKSIALRTLISLFIFLCALYFGRNLIVSSIAFVLALLVCTYLFAIRPFKYESLDTNFKFKRVCGLLGESKWLFISSFLDLYIFAASKFAVDKVMGVGVNNSYYTTIFIPTSIINLMAGFVIRPLLTSLAEDYENKNGDAFKKSVAKVVKIIAGLSVPALAASAFLGKPVLGILLKGAAKEDLPAYVLILIIVVAGGSFYAVMNLMYYVMVIFKRQRRIFALYGAGTVLAFLISDRAVYMAGMQGAAVSYCLLMFLLAAVFSILAYTDMRKL